MRKNILIFAVVALVAGSGGYFLAMVADPFKPANQPGSASTGADIMPVRDVEDLLGQRRPDFTLSDLDGNTISASDFDGRTWLVNFWATWCTPCVEEMPMLSQLQKIYAEQGLRVVGIALDDAERARDFAAQLAIDYTVLVGKTDVVLTGRRFGNATGMLPFSVLIDSGGMIRWTHLGALSREELKRQIESIN